jgi:glycosyltransferase involved in cell wall biosynthesis
MKRLLMIAYHFPPLAGSSGIQRTLRFVQHLPRHSWQPLVLSVTPGAYERVSDDLMDAIPRGTVVRRAFTLDAARHLAIRGRYPGALARPDRWASWKYDGVRQGLKLIREHRPDAIWSTYPIATAHVIAAELQRRTGLPWIADFRDPMAQDDYPPDPRVWAQFKAIEEQAAAAARWCTFTTPSAVRTYRQRYPQAASRMVLLENGYDEETFSRCRGGEPLQPGTLTLLHSGIVYPAERDPTQLFVALAALKAQGGLADGRLKVRFRAPVHEELLRQLASAHAVEEMVEVLPALPYQEALDEMLRADALLVMQAGNCNEQVPAKLYEYMRARRPIVCLSDPRGDTWGVLRQAGVQDAARLDDASDIARLLQRVARGENAALSARRDAVEAASRERRAGELCECLAAL